MNSRRRTRQELLQRVAAVDFTGCCHRVRQIGKLLFFSAAVGYCFERFHVPVSAGRWLITQSGFSTFRLVVPCEFQKKLERKYLVAKQATCGKNVLESAQRGAFRYFVRMTRK